MPHESLVGIAHCGRKLNVFALRVVMMVAVASPAPDSTVFGPGP